jgi:hypothetical protein
MDTNDEKKDILNMKRIYLDFPFSQNTKTHPEWTI